MKADLINVGIQDEQTDAHGSNGTTQVAIGYKQNDPSLTYPHLVPPKLISFPASRCVKWTCGN